MKNHYDLKTQQAPAWSGMLLKIVDVGAKWAAIATLLSVFTGISLNQGILITGAITAIYCTIGGLSRSEHSSLEHAPSTPKQASQETPRTCTSDCISIRDVC